MSLSYNDVNLLRNICCEVGIQTAQRLDDLATRLQQSIDDTPTHYCTYVQPKVGHKVKTIVTPVGWEDVVGEVIPCDETDTAWGWHLVRWSNGEESYERAHLLYPVARS